NESNAISITERYLDEKLKELQLTYEYHEKRQREKEEQAEIKAQMREEAKIEAEIKKAEADAIKEEKRYQKALETARQELTEASDEAKAALESQIAELQASLEEAERKHQRAQSMAEQTKQGHVYIISNIGSFGEEVYKIGMTRRLEPMDRVKELGDASVPFTFDVHAMIHTTDAPTLEKNLHDKFDSRRLNMVNRRKEFFNVSLDEIKQAVQGFTDHDVEFIETAVAQDYYETKAMKKQQLLKEGQLLENEISVSSKLLEFADEL
ncbi:GIY-YIG nuclease family protein, partial [Vibrio fluvialis]